MKLVSFDVQTPVGPLRRIGALASDDRIVDLQSAYDEKLRDSGLTDAAASRVSTALLPGDMTAFIEGGPVSLDAAREALNWGITRAEGSPDNRQVLIYSASETKLLAPVPRPPLLRDFMAFETHLRQIYPKMGRTIPDEWYKIPVYYKGNPGSIAGQGDRIPIPSYAETLDYEFEMAFVIGKGGINIPPERAMEHVLGFMIYNDFSARQIQSREMEVGLGPAKGKDFIFGHVFGPALVTLDEIPDVYDLDMKFTINGELAGEANSGSIHWKFEQMIAHASTDEQLRPGEIFGTGTVGGGAGTETGRFLTSGDVIELTVTGLGTLSNSIV
jgi:2-keto-4-pentenoate hydratase/2-oxohepta-3-ene-1,7-dioic acid hydratase in catechol pathway